MTPGRFTLIAALLPAALAQTPAPAAAQRAAPASLVAAARAVTREVAAIRGLPVRRPIDFQVSDRSTIRGYAREALAREMSADEWEAYEALLAHVGLIPPDLDLEEIVLALYVEQIAGYYDPGRKTFYLADWLPHLLQRAVVAHEVTHALQDQHFDLERWLAEASPTEDAVLARAAVVEGDAMASMLAYLLVPTGVPPESLPAVGALLGQRGAAIGAAFPTFDRAPEALQRLLLFPYVEGADFVLASLRRGGWETVDGLYRDPPASTEQILHPERYWETRDPPRPLETPGPAEPPPWTAGSWGEFGIALVLEAALGDSAAANAAARGWDGDRFALRRTPDGALLYAWSSLWDSEADARQFAEAYAQTVVRRFPGSARIETGAGRFAFEGSGRRVEVRRVADRVEVLERLAPVARGERPGTAG